MSADATDAGRIRPARGAMVWQAAAEEYRRFVALLRQLDAADWSRPTDCTRWDVRQLALHVLAATHANASPQELVHQFRAGLPLNRQIESHH
ncbi:MAG: maleylpyruvate isomerase N-terminal domain-containing protein [Actinomycetota bacterium]|nr:maleylpyruvate isomerase N-terminal domain-containing protein [Actinomycetota bacterium]